MEGGRGGRGRRRGERGKKGVTKAGGEEGMRDAGCVRGTVCVVLGCFGLT
jgi:hypothetical protein